MSSPPNPRKVTFKQLGGWRGLARNPGLVLSTWRLGSHVGEDADGNQYFETRSVAKGQRPRRWVVYAGRPEASAIGPEWHPWLHYVTAAPLAAPPRPWQKPHQPNLTGTPAGYRPAGHDYRGGQRARNSSDYEVWSPDP